MAIEIGNAASSIGLQEIYSFEMSLQIENQSSFTANSYIPLLVDGESNRDE